MLIFDSIASQFQAPQSKNLLHWPLAFPCETSGWTLVGSQHHHINKVVWLRVYGEELFGICPQDFIQDRLLQIGETEATAVFLTSARLEDAQLIEIEEGNLKVRVLATVGLGNALRAGDPSSPAAVGTINIACEVSCPLTLEARLEALSIITEAKCLATIESGIISYKSRLPATGTGTDCSLICTASSDISAESYAGKHTLLGQLIGKASYQAVDRGIAIWKGQNSTSPVIQNPKQGRTFHG